MATPERLPIHNRTRRTLDRTTTRGTLFDLLAYSSTFDIMKYETDFIGGTIDPQIIVTGGAGTNGALTATDNNGSLTMATGAVDNQCSLLYLAGGNYLGNNNPVVACRIKVDSIATGNVQFGFCDNIAAGVLTSSGVGPFVSPLASPPTLVSTTADAVALTYDLSSLLTTPSRWRLAYSRASTAAVVIGSSTAASVAAPTANVYQWLVVALERSPVGTPNMAAKAYVNGVKIAEVSIGAISNAVALYPFLLVGATSSAARSMVCDVFAAWQDRDTSA